MTRHAVLLALALCAMAGAAGTTPFDASLPPELQGAAVNPKYTPPPPTDDSMWVKIDSVPSISSYQGMYVHGDTIYMAYQSARIDIIYRPTGATITTFPTLSGTVIAVCRFGDSICVAKLATPAACEVYTLAGTYVRTFYPSGGQQVRGLDWDGTRFWASSYVSPNLTFYAMDRAGTVVKTLTRTGGIPITTTIARDFELDDDYPNRFWSVVSTTAPYKVMYCALDTVANTWTALDTFQTTLNGYSSPLGYYSDPVIGGCVYTKTFVGSGSLRLQGPQPDCHR